jgi:hypothetical protein
MIRSVILDLSATQRAVLDRPIRRLSQLSARPKVAAGDDIAAGSGDLFITENQDHAMAARQNGATVWTVQPGSGELDHWVDLPLALAFANGTLDELRKELTERPELQRHAISSLSWTPQGDATGSTDDGKPIFATAGPDGETPQVFVGPEAESRESEARVYLQTLLANNQVSLTGDLGSGQTHTLTNSEGRRPVLRRRGFYSR